jgi:hypothetical protein
VAPGGRARARRLPLRGADLVLIAMQRLWPDERISHNTVLVVECEGAVAPERVRRAVAGFLDVCPWPAARLRRPFPWGKLHWAAGPRTGRHAPALQHRRVESPAHRHAVLEAELNAVIEPRHEPPLRIAIVDEPAASGAAAPVRSTLAMTWFHPLMDPRGGQNLLGHLAALDRHGGGAPWASRTDTLVAPPDRRPLRERGRLARRSVAYMRSLMPVAPVSPGTGVRTFGAVRFAQHTFGEPRPDASGGPERRDICWRLAIVGRAMAELWRRRGLPDVPFLVPISVDLRPKGDAEPTFGNALAFHFARFRPSETADLGALERALRRQMVDAMRDGQIEANAAAMEFLHYRPFRVMLRDLPGTAAGETFSFNCADVGAFPPVVDLVFGTRVVNAYHVPAVLPRPGIGVFFNRCASRNNLVVSWIEGAVTEDEVARVVEVVREGMRW